MKNFAIIVLAALLVFSLVGCGGGTPKPAETQPVTTAATEAPVTEPVPDTTAAPETEPAAAEPEAPSQKDIAIEYIDHPVEELFEAIGYPESSDYAPSCLAQGGEDGNLYYDGFIVYTLRTGEEEVVHFVD